MASKILLVFPLVLALAGCAATPPLAAPPVQAQAGDAAPASGLSAVLRITTADRGTLALSHRWVPTDVYEYRVVLFGQDVGHAFTVNVANVTVAKNQSSAVFSNLKANSVYQAQIQAWGNNGGTAATTQLNTGANLATQLYDFSAANDVNTSLSATVNVKLDDQPFSGTGTVTMGTPTPGAYVNPVAAESGTAQ